MSLNSDSGDIQLLLATFLPLNVQYLVFYNMTCRNLIAGNSSKMVSCLVVLWPYCICTQVGKCLTWEVMLEVHTTYNIQQLQCTTAGSKSRLTGHVCEQPHTISAAAAHITHATVNNIFGPKYLDNRCSERFDMMRY